MLFFVLLILIIIFNIFDYFILNFYGMLLEINVKINFIN